MSQKKSQPTETVCAGEIVHLLPEGAAFWPGGKALLVADLHLGKTAAFQQSGIPVPEGGMEEDLTRISSLCSATRAETLIFLGDFFHAPAGRTRSMLDRGKRWIDSLDGLRIVLVMGNHDLSAGCPPADWGIDIFDEQMQAGPFTMIHEADGDESGFSFSGHLHPSVRVRGSSGARGGLRVPCFWQQQNRGIVLPAFGSFTGTHSIRPAKGDRIWGLSDGEIAEIPSVLVES